MKRIPGLIFCFLFIAGFSHRAAAQVPKQQGRCSATLSQVYYVEDGQMRLDVYPPAPHGYQLNILGTGVDNFELVQESYMSAVYIIPNYTSPTAAKWQVNFAPNMERVLCSVTLKNKSTGQVMSYSMTSGVRLFTQ